jgi:hypothetical protein
MPRLAEAGGAEGDRSPLSPPIAGALVTESVTAGACY